MTLKLIAFNYITFQVFWKIMSDAETTGDFSNLQGFATILAGQRVAEIILTLLPDSVPELEESYTLRLMSVEGGAELDTNRSTTILKVRANDEPHGVFALYPQNQSVVLNAADRSRNLIISVTRLAGAFGNVSVGYRISFNTPGQSFTEDTMIGNILVKDGEQEASAKVPLSSQVCYLHVCILAWFVIENPLLSILGCFDRGLRHT